jgi:D-glycero-alpha-D-manno-heptose-7-phosphate kinase
MDSLAATTRPGVIMTRTPLRVSFAGGGTDFPAFYQCEPGAVFSTAINKYVYVTIKRHGDLFDQPIRLNYSETELVQQVEQIENGIARECLRLLRISPPIYISVVADVPAANGLGSSSSFAVGLLNALHVYRGERVSAGDLAEEASRVEIDALKRPIGKQDQYAAAFGGLNLFRFQPDGSVTVEPQQLPEGAIEKLFAHVMMFWTGMMRDSSTVLLEQSRNTQRKMAELLAMRDHALQLKALAAEGLEPVRLGKLLDETWQLKRQLATNISNDRIDLWYRRALEAGACGGKLCGAGGGGFLLFIVPPGRQAAVRAALHDLRELPVGYEAHGARLLFPLID